VIVDVLNGLNVWNQSKPISPSEVGAWRRFLFDYHSRFTARFDRERGGVPITPKFEILKSKTEVPSEVVWKIRLWIDARNSIGVV
jgi:hypothetical protein